MAEFLYDGYETALQLRPVIIQMVPFRFVYWEELLIRMESLITEISTYRAKYARGF